MKKFIALVMAVAMLATLMCACSTDGDTKPADTQSNGEATLTTVNPGKLTMATNAAFPPYEFVEGEKIVGIDAEVAGLIAAKLGLELEIVNVEFKSIIPGVQSGKYDIGMAGMTVTEDRKRSVDFSTSYAKGVQSVIVKTGGSIKSLDDLKGKIIGVQQSTTGDIYATDEFGDENIVRYPNGALAVEGLKTGKVECVIIDNQPAKVYISENTGLELLDVSYADEDYAISFSKDNPTLRDKANAALEELIADGSVQKVVDKYIKAN